MDCPHGWCASNTSESDLLCDHHKALRAACAMSDETGERDDDVTVDEQGCIVQGEIVVQTTDEVRAKQERDSYEAWRKKEASKRRLS